MKRLNWIFMAICLAVMPALQSCDNDEGYSLGDFTPPLWATVRVTGGAFYLDCDVWGKLWPTNTNLGGYDAIDGQRVITSFTPLSDKYQDYDHMVKILSISDVKTKGVETLTPENDKEFGNDPVTIYKGDIGISGGYMNIIFVQDLPSKEKHRISLVRPQADDALYADDGYIHLELRYNDYDDVTGFLVYGAVSYNLNSLKMTADTKGIKLNINSKTNGDVTLTFDRSEADKTAEKAQGKDLSRVMLK